MSSPTPRSYLRQPAGIPTGGQFAGQLRAEASALTPDDATVAAVSDLLASRRAALADAGYVPAASLPSVNDPRSTAHRRQWWDEHFGLGEYGHADGDYPHMPDDEVPSKYDGSSYGRSLERNRRTHRVRYEGAGVVMRMPSATAIKRYAANTGAHTFDVPVSADHPEGTVTGWVRVTRGDDGTWATRGLGFRDSDNAYVAEACQAILEARRPTMALKDAGNLIERRRARAAAVGARTVPVDSSWIKEVGYVDADRTMVVATGSGSTYGYRVPPAAYQAVARAFSPGATFNALVRGRAQRVGVTQCGKCQRFTASGSHRCPPKETGRALEDRHTAAQRSAGARGFWRRLSDR